MRLRSLIPLIVGCLFTTFSYGDTCEDIINIPVHIPGSKCLESKALYVDKCTGQMWERIEKEGKVVKEFVYGSDGLEGMGPYVYKSGEFSGHFCNATVINYWVDEEEGLIYEIKEGHDYLYLELVTLEEMEESSKDASFEEMFVFGLLVFFVASY